ncbi:hypothetical protein SEA_OTTAWA_103 [Arthrobacter phage Ottawa]|nr:hypothetical protein SEA_KHARCHO_103 [Arthrobacter phage Kharcho]WIC89335.1 hypothetical protein SEA_OTTAWA_103 [Arthrobacter phage Ottawa]
MAWTYSGNPAGSDLDKVRFLLGDTTQTASATLTNEEITYLLAEEGGNTTSAAAEGALALAARYSGISATSKKIGDLSISYEHGALADRFTALAARLRKGQRSAFTPIWDDSSPSIFSIGMDDYAEGS